MTELDNVQWLGHASFLIDDSVYIDPFQLKGNLPPADVIFITHAHYDHWSLKDIEKIITPNTQVILVNGCDGLKTGKIIKTEPFKQFTVNDIDIRTIPAYNTYPEKQQFHPRINSWVGYILEIDGVKIYHSGDSDFIPEMEGLKPDVALLPIGGTYTMDVNEAIKAANAIQAKITVPMHYRMLLKDNSSNAVNKFIDGVKGQVKILKEQ